MSDTTVKILLIIWATGAIAEFLMFESMATPRARDKTDLRIFFVYNAITSLVWFIYIPVFMLFGRESKEGDE